MSGSAEGPGSGAVGGSGETLGPSRPATSDWDRYGLTRAAAGSSVRGFQPDADIHGSVGLRDDLYAEYRQKSGIGRKSAPRQRARARANFAGFSLIGIVAATFLVAGIVATHSITKPAPSVSPKPTATPITVEEPRPIPLSVTVDLPAAVAVPDRATAPDDGMTMYLAGSDGAVAVNSASRDVKLLKGPAFAPGIGRHLVAGGKLWSGTFDPNGSCDPGCWDQSTTFMVDGQTGHVDEAFAGTYLVGTDGGWIWIASRVGVQKLDPTDGEVQDTIPWALEAEPRVGCGGLWAWSRTDSGTALTKVDIGTGKAVGKPAVVDGHIVGPTQVDGGCWLVDVDAAGIGWGGMTQLATDGSIAREVSSDTKVVILDGEFWSCAPEGRMQRLHPGSGAYGPQIRLAVTTVSGYPNTLFASLHTLWILDYQGRLIGFDVATGAGSAGA